jgi:hypothetical protein
MLPDTTEHAKLGEPVLAPHEQRERARERSGSVQARGRRAVGGGDLLLAPLLRDEDEEVREPRELLLPRPARPEAQVALELARERAARLGGPVVLEVELADSAGMQVASEPVGLHLGGPGPDPVLGPPGGQAMALEGSGDLGERAEERVHPQPMGDHLARAVAGVRHPGKVRGPDVLGVGDLDEALLCEVPARGCPPLPETPPHREG